MNRYDLGHLASPCVRVRSMNSGLDYSPSGLKFKCLFRTSHFMLYYPIGAARPASQPIPTSDPFLQLSNTKIMENVSMPAQSAASDELLIQKFKDGNSDAFDALYQRHLASVYNRVRY